MSDLRKMKDEPVGERGPQWIGLGNFEGELVELGRGEWDKSGGYTYFDFRLTESDNPEFRVGEIVRKVVSDTSFSVQREIKEALAALTGESPKALEWARDCVPVILPADEKGKPLNEVGKGAGSEALEGTKVRIKGEHAKYGKKNQSGKEPGTLVYNKNGDPVVNVYFSAIK